MEEVVQTPQNDENQDSWLKQVSSAVEKKSFVSRKATKHSFRVYDVAETAPREYICPISLELMRDPVLLVETGQVYDRTSIEGWFKAGKSTCPVSGAKVKHMRLSPIYPLRSAIQSFAKEQHMELEMIEGKSDDDIGVDDVLASATLFEGVSVYDVRGLSQLATTADEEMQITALKLLADMARYGDTCQRMKISRMVSREKVVSTMRKSEEGPLMTQATRLLLHLPGTHFDYGQQLRLLRLNNITLREEILLKLWRYAYRHRSKMIELASLIDRYGAEEIIAICKKIADPTENTDISDEARSCGAFLLACTVFKKTTRIVAINQEVVPMLVNRLHATSNMGFRFCLMKALQYISETVEGRKQVIRAGGVRIFVMALPARNRAILYTTRVYVDWFAWVTVAETAVKALYYLAFEDQGRTEMRTTATMKALRHMVNQNSFPDSARARYLMPLLTRLSMVTT